MSGPVEKLIITTGDASDADGFLSLAMYAQNGTADVMYIMTLPACYDTEQRKKGELTASAINESTGLNDVTDPRKRFLLMLDSSGVSMNEYGKGYNYRGDHDPDDIVDMCKTITRRIWDTELPEGSEAQLFFVSEHGGSKFYNEINGFAAGFLLDELKTYAIFNPKSEAYIAPQDGGANDMPSFGDYSEIYMDMNGSVPFMTTGFGSVIENVLSLPSFKGLFVMGGVDASRAAPSTLLFAGLNRFPLSTMNQFYAPKATEKLFALMKDLPMWFVSNDEVNTNGFFNKNGAWFGNKDMDPTELGQKNVELLERLLSMFGAYTQRIARQYYLKSKGPGDRKMFDLMTSAVLLDKMDMSETGVGVKSVTWNYDLASTQSLEEWRAYTETSCNLFYDGEFGTTVLFDGPRELIGYLGRQINANVESVNESQRPMTEAYNTMLQSVLSFVEGRVPGTVYIKSAPTELEGGARNNNTIAMAALALTTFAMAIFGSVAR
jgi:hypothetical protein